jgi:hypothetical protein
MLVDDFRDSIAIDEIEYERMAAGLIHTSHRQFIDYSMPRRDVERHRHVAEVILMPLAFEVYSCWQLFLVIRNHFD